jgi:hypothetical protein
MKFNNLGISSMKKLIYNQPNQSALNKRKRKSQIFEHDTATDTCKGF